MEIVIKVFGSKALQVLQKAYPRMTSQTEARKETGLHKGNVYKHQRMTDWGWETEIAQVNDWGDVYLSYFKEADLLMYEHRAVTDD